MSNNEELDGILLEILREGLLRIRGRGWDGRPDQCAIEADHLHNLPELIRTPRPELLAYYLGTSRPAFIKEGTHAETFNPLWNRLESILITMRSESSNDTK